MGISRARSAGPWLLMLLALVAPRAAAEPAKTGVGSPKAPEPGLAAASDSSTPAPDTAARGALEAPRRYGELAGLPAVAGNETYGIIVGVTGSYTRFAPGYRPFRFRAQLTAVTSMKGSDTGIRFPLQNVDLRLDFPGLLSNRVRVFALLRYQRILDVGYWGIGNGASGDIPPDYAGPRGRFFNYEKQMGEGRVFLRYRLVPHLELVSGLGARVVHPNVLADSRLARDLRGDSPARELLVGYSDHQIYDGLVGLLLDTRDDEFNPSRGGYHELSLRGGAGPSRDKPLYYGALYLYTRWFFPVVDERLVIALRGLTELGGGAMPLLELGSIGGYTSLYGPAGLEANRGLPYGRQLGRVKLLTSAELRSTFYRFTGFNQQFALGAALFVDASRVWAQLAPTPELDGGPFLRFAVGGGPRLVWGRGLVLRVDVGFGPGAGANGKNHVSGSLALGHAF